MTACQREGCEREATHYPCILVPAIGHKAVPPNLVESAVGLKLCKDHAASQDHVDSVPKEVRLKFNAALAAMRKQCVDWKRARVEARPLGDDLWQSLGPR